MADENTVNNEDNTQTEIPEPTRPARSVDELCRAVKDLVKQKHDAGEVRQRIINELADELIAERVGWLRAALQKRDELAKKVNQVRPDLVGYDVDGKKVSETYSKSRLDELRKTKEELEKADRAIDKAVKDADYELVKKLIGKG